MLTRLFKLRRLRTERRGVAAVEFAVIAPIVVMVFLGLIELSEGVNCKERMENMASTAADLVAQTTSISNVGVANVFAASRAIMFPYSDTATIRISSLTIDPNDATKGKVVWSDSSVAGNTRAVGSAIDNLPTGVITPGGSVIMAEVTYIYTSPVGIFRFNNGNLVQHANNGVTMQSTFYSRPRRSVTVTRT